MIKEAIEHISESARKREIERKPWYEVGDRQFWKRNDLEILPAEPDCLELTTLRGFVDYIQSSEASTAEAVIIRGVCRVDLLSGAHGPRKTRERIAACVPQRCGSFPVCSHLGLEDFIINSLSVFAHTPDLDSILRVVGTVEAESVRTSADDGVTQVVAVREGVRSKSVPISNPIKLKPYRTFPELEQPECEFVFRLQGHKDKLTAGLWPVEDPMWKIRTIDAIREYLIAALPPDHIPIFA